MSESHTRQEYNSIIEKCKRNFKDHEVHIESQDLKNRLFKFVFKQKNWEYGMEIVCASNLIAISGDCGDIMLTPGYGRCGLSFIRGSIRSYNYLLEKSPFYGTKNPLVDYSYNQAMQNLKEAVYDECVTQEQVDDIYGLDENYWHGCHAYYEFCHENDIDEPSSPEVYRHSTLNMIAGLLIFTEKLDEMGFEED